MLLKVKLENTIQGAQAPRVGSQASVSGTILSARASLRREHLRLEELGQPFPRSLRVVDQGMEPLLVLRVGLGDVGDEAMGHHLHVVGEARADNCHRPLHPDVEMLTPFLGTCLGWQDKVAVRCLQSGLPMRMVADEGEVECD